MGGGGGVPPAQRVDVPFCLWTLYQVHACITIMWTLHFSNPALLLLLFHNFPFVLDGDCSGIFDIRNKLIVIFILHIFIYRNIKISSQPVTSGGTQL